MRPDQRRTAEGILFTDQYQLTMAQLYFRQGLHEKEAQFDHFFRRYPNYGDHQAGYCVNAGLASLLDWMREARFGDEEIDALRGQRSSSGAPLFGTDFLNWLREHGHFGAVSLRAIPEGRLVHPGVPLTIVRGPLATAQLLETALLNHLNYQTLIATKAARIHQAARGQTVLEFGLRRAQDRAAIAGARAALIGGADFTSNVGISHVLGFDPKGTHAHSMIQAFMALGGSELDAFTAYAELYPDDCLLLVDTINTLESGVPNAIRVFEGLRRKGHRPVGVRLDSGDLAYLTVETALQLDAAGFPETTIVLSNSLDELTIWQILAQIRDEARQRGRDPEPFLRRLVFGVGTNLITSRGAAALDGVYKLVALRGATGWQPAIKISETPEKTPNPGLKQAWRIYDRRDRATADVLALEEEALPSVGPLSLRHPTDHTRYRTLEPNQISAVEVLHVDYLRDGELAADLPPIATLRERRLADLDRLDVGVQRLMNPHLYHISLTAPLWELKQALIHAARSGIKRSGPAA